MRKHYSVHIFQRINLFRRCLLFKESSRIFLCCALRNICWTIWFELGAFPLSLFLAICQFLSGGFYCLEAICMCIFGSYIRLPFQSGKEWEDTPAQPQPYQVSKPSPLDSRSYSCDVWTAFVNSDWNKKKKLLMTDKLAETCCWRQSGCFSLRNNGLSPALSFWKLKVDQREIKGRRQLCPCLHVTSLDNSPVM